MENINRDHLCIFFLHTPTEPVSHMETFTLSVSFRFTPAMRIISAMSCLPCSAVMWSEVCCLCRWREKGLHFREGQVWGWKNRTLPRGAWDCLMETSKIEHRMCPFCGVIRREHHHKCEDWLKQGMQSPPFRKITIWWHKQLLPGLPPILSPPNILQNIFYLEISPTCFQQGGESLTMQYCRGHSTALMLNTIKWLPHCNT